MDNELVCHACGNSHAVKCYKCDRPALFLCDAIVPPDNEFQATYLTTDPTCDKPMCEHHKFTANVQLFICGPAGVEAPSREYCHEHEIMAKEKGYYLYPRRQR